MRSLLLFFLLSISPLFSQEIDFYTDLPSEVLAPLLLDRMDPVDKVSQVLLFSYTGTSPDQEFQDWVFQRGLGGVKIFGWNSVNMRAMARAITRLQELASDRPLKIPMIVATDQEGGWVRHIPEGTSSTSGNLSLGASGRPMDAYLTGYYIGLELAELGVNMNFAPTVDVFTNMEAHVIGPRAFSSNAKDTSVLGAAFSRGSQEALVIPTAKHFPGHGEAAEDSHLALPQIDLTMEDIWDRELLPYRKLIQEGIPAIMVGHLAYPYVDPTGTPASLSSEWITEILKGDLGFQGVVVTDDLHMEGSRTWADSIQEVCEKSFMAGSDLIMLSQTTWEQRQVYNHFISLANSDEQFLSRLNESVLRILTMKLRFLKEPNSPLLDPIYPPEDGELGSNEAQDFFRDQSYRSVTVFGSAAFPPDFQDQKILMVTPYASLARLFQEEIAPANILGYDYFPFYRHQPTVLRNIRSVAGDYDKIVFVMVTPGSAELLELLEEQKDKIFVFSLLSPGYLQRTPWVQSALAVYGRDRVNFRAGIDALAGRFEPEGIPPVQVLD